MVQRFVSTLASIFSKPEWYAGHSSDNGASGRRHRSVLVNTSALDFRQIEMDTMCGNDLPVSRHHVY